MLRNTSTSGRRRLGAIVAATTLLALLGAACMPVQAPLAAPQNPTGNLDLVEGGKGEVRVAGWATQRPPYGADGSQIFLYAQRTTQIVVWIDGEWAQGAIPADDPRPDVEALVAADPQIWAWRQPNQGYGFDATKPAAPGEVTVCVAALNPFLAEWGPQAWTGPVDHVLLGCRTVTVT